MSLEVTDHRDTLSCISPSWRKSLDSQRMDCQLIKCAARFEAVQLARHSRTIDMMISKAKSVICPHTLADLNESIVKEIQKTQGFLARRDSIRFLLLNRGHEWLWGFAKSSEASLRVVSRALIQRVLDKSRSCTLSMIAIIRDLEAQRTASLDRLRIECDLAFVNVIDSSRKYMLNFGQTSAELLRTHAGKAYKSLTLLCDASQSRLDRSCEERLDAERVQVVSELSAAKESWEFDDLSRDNLKEKLSRLNVQIRKTRRQKESKRKLLKAKKETLYRKNEALVNDLIQIQSRYIRLLDKSRHGQSLLDEKLDRIHSSNYEEIQELLGEVWGSFTQLKMEMPHIQSQDDVKVMYDLLPDRAPRDTESCNPYEDVLKVNDMIYEQVSIIFNHLSDHVGGYSPSANF